MPARKRGRAEMEAAEPPQPPSLLTQIRNRWELANLMQYIQIFGDAIKIDSEIDIEDLENELIRTENSEKLVEIGLCLLKVITPSNRSLTLDTFEHHARNAYKKCQVLHRSPFGPESEPATKFFDFDVFTKLHVLWQLSQLTLRDPTHIREVMEAQEKKEGKKEDQTFWRIEETGYDKDGRSYFVLDDNRLYRRTDPAPGQPAKKPKANSKAGRALARANKKRKSNARKEVSDEEERGSADTKKDVEESLLGGMKWECIAVSKTDYDEFLDKMRRSKNADEKAMAEVIHVDVMPLLEQAEARRQRKIQQREKELRIQERMVHAKRSSRIASKQEKEREAIEAAAAEQKKQEVLADHKKNVNKEQEREKRIRTREQRIKELEAKRILEEEGIRELSEAQEKGETRVSARATKARIEKKRKALEELEEEEDWTFDCSGCGKYGQNFDDGSHSLSCEKCKVWQHSKCLGISEADAEKDDFHFVCTDFKRKEEDAKKPKIPPLKLKATSSVSPPSNKNKKVKLSSDSIEVQVPKKSFPPPQSIISNGIHLNRPAAYAPVATKTTSTVPKYPGPVPTYPNPTKPDHPAPTSHHPHHSPHTSSSYVYSNAATPPLNGTAQQALLYEPRPPTHPSPNAHPRRHISPNSSSPTSSNNVAAYHMNGVASQFHPPKSASNLPPIGHFAPPSRTHSNSISAPTPAPPAAKPEPPPHRPSLPAYTSPWAQPNGSSEQKAYIPPPQPQVQVQVPAHTPGSATAPVTNSISVNANGNGNLANGAIPHGNTSQLTPYSIEQSHH